MKTPMQKLIDALKFAINGFKDEKDPEDIAYKRGLEDALMHAKQALKEEKKHYKFIRITEYPYNQNK
jgi:hypothetical protein